MLVSSHHALWDNKLNLTKLNTRLKNSLFSTFKQLNFICVPVWVRKRNNYTKKKKIKIKCF